MPDPITAAVVGVGGSIMSSNAQEDAARTAAAAQQQSTADQLAFQREVYERGRADFTPYRDLGSYAAQRLGRRLGMPQSYGTTAGQSLASATQYNTPTGRVTAPAGSTQLFNEGTQTLRGVRTPTGEYMDLAGAQVYTDPFTSYLQSRRQTAVTPPRTAWDIMRDSDVGLQ